MFSFISSCESNNRCLSMPRIITENVVHSVEFLDLPSGQGNFQNGRQQIVFKIGI